MEPKKKLKKRLKNASPKKAKYYHYQDLSFKYFALGCTILGLLILAVLMFKIFADGFSRIDMDFILNGPSSRAENAGIWTSFIGTLWIMVITALIGFPIGIGSAIYLEEYAKKSKLASFIEINISNLAGVPSIIYGLLGLELFARAMMFEGSILTGSLTLALLILPVIIVSTREALKAVPYTIREASYALGATKWQTIWNQVLPASISGIFTGVILALSRAVGETAPLIVVGALTFVPFIPSGIMDEYSVLPIQIFNWVSRPQHEFKTNAAAAIIILLLITFLMNAIAVYMRYRWQRKIKW